MTNIVICNGPGVLDNGQEVILFPSRWDSGLPGQAKKPFAFFPYELALTSALLKRELPDANVKMLDPNIESWGGDRMIAEIAKLQPDVLLFECSALTYPTVTRVMQTVQDRAYGTTQTILCGPMATYERADLDGWTDTIKGEYELGVLELLGGTVPDEARVHGLVNLDWLPWAEDSDIDRSRYYEINHYASPPFLDMYLSRGCSMSCSFCLVPTYYGGHGKSFKSHRVRDVEDCCNEILYLKAKYNMNGCYFNEELHNANVPWLVELCEAFIKHGMKDKHKLQFDAMTGYWTYTEELVELMARAGYKQLRFGVESTSEVVGKKIGKTIHLERMERFLGWCKKYGIYTYGTVQIGAQGSSEETDRQTIADVKRWYAQGLMQKHQVSTSVPQPGTPFFDEAKRNGWLLTEDINLYDGFRSVISYPHYSAERINAVRAAA